MASTTVIPTDGIKALRKYAPQVRSKIKDADEDFRKRFNRTTEGECMALLESHCLKRFEDQAQPLLSLDWAETLWDGWLESLIGDCRHLLITLIKPPSDLQKRIKKSWSILRAGSAERQPVSDSAVLQVNAVGSILTRLLRKKLDMLAEAKKGAWPRLPIPQVSSKHVNPLAALMKDLDELAAKDHSYAESSSVDKQWTINGADDDMAFKDCASEAVEIFDLIDQARGRESWQVWLDLLRQETNGYKITSTQIDVPGNGTTVEGEVGRIANVVEVSHRYIRRLWNRAHKAHSNEEAKGTERVLPKTRNEKPVEIGDSIIRGKLSAAGRKSGLKRAKAERDEKIIAQAKEIQRSEPNIKVNRALAERFELSEERIRQIRKTKSK